MRRHGQTSREPALFDLPLVVDPELAGKVDRLDDSDELPSPEPTVEAEQIELTAEPAAEPAEAASEPRPATLIRRRLQAGIIDTAVGAAALGALFYGTAELGAPARPSDWPAYVVVILEFTFLYAVFSTVFWGRTPGMMRAHLVAGPVDGGGLTLGRAVLRWLGGVATVALLGLPTLLVLHEGRSLADHLSGSRTEPS